MKTGKLQRQWAMTKASAKVGTKAASQMWLGALADPFDKEKRQKNQKRIMSEQSQALVEELGKLKGSIVKVGQMMALYGEHVVPEEIHQALRQLEECNEPIAYSVIEESLKQALGERFNEFTVDRKALGSASLAQVHKAQLNASIDDLPKQVLCFKVQYPNIKKTVHSDIHSLLGLLRIAGFKKNSDASSFISDLEQALLDELDYEQEAAMIKLFDELVHASEFEYGNTFVLPQVLDEFCADEVLCESFLSGVAVNTIDIETVSLDRRNHLAKAFLSLFLHEVFEWKVLQTDPNFGNYRVNLDDQQDLIGLIDFGSVKAFDDSFIEPVRLMITGAVLDDKERAIAGAIGLGIMQEDFPDDVLDDFYDLCRLLVEPFYLYQEDSNSEYLNANTQYCWARSQLPKRAAKHAAKSALSKYFAVPPKEFAFLSRKLLGVYAFISALEAEFNPEGFLDKWLQ